MLKITLILAIVAVVAASSIPADIHSKAVLKVLTPEEMEKYLKENPQAQPLTRKVTEESTRAGQTRYVMTYMFGAREEGDGLVSLNSQYNTWDEQYTVSTSITYPQSVIVGALITYIEIEVNQSSRNGSAYINAGGPGFRHTVVIVEATSTFWFNMAYNIYGRA